MDGEAVQAHFEHDFFRALQLELADLLAEPVAVRPMAPVARHVPAAFPPSSRPSLALAWGEC